MARGQKEAADAQRKTTNTQAGIVGGRAGDIFSSLMPQLQGMASNPQGYSTTDLNSMRTGSRQALGGANAGVTGLGSLLGARTRNTAGIPAALGEAMRESGRIGSQNELGIEKSNADLKQAQQQQALSALGGLYGTNLGNATDLYGQGVGALGARAAGGGWTQGFKDIVGSVGNFGR